MSPSLPDKPSLDGLEQKWAETWEAAGTYRFDRSKPRAEIYSIDTPPPTVSGSLHVGHVFSYTHTDAIARYHRMRGREVFYPMGWDDNGLPTERRVQNFYGVRCDPALPYDPDFEPPEKPGKEPVAVSRPNFVELCNRLTVEDEKVFERLWRTLGLSIDWTLTYATIHPRAQRTSQRAFLRMLARGEAYRVESPTLWDVDFRTAVAQAELEDREQVSAYHRVHFHRADGGGPVDIETTRPELIPACVALVVHPEDPRYRPLFETEVLSPLFGVRIPVKPHPLADPAKGTGIAMVCTFGDVTDVTWWRELKLPVRMILQPDGRLRPIVWGDPGWESVDPAAARERYDQLAGLTVKRARERVVELLAESGDLVGEPKPTTHPVKFFEKGDRPLEILSSRQWFVRTLDLRDELLERGAQLDWHPPYMRARYDGWVQGLNTDWCISRQRFFGVPFPVWYPIDATGAVDYDHPILPGEDALPVDPSTDAPPGYTEAQRHQPGGFEGDADVMDTWATSSLTPQIAGGWADDPDLFARVFPMDLRPQAHEIIRTWLFSTVVRSHLEHGSLPWKSAAISGWVLDPDRKKMSKSKGNVVTPIDMLREHGSDGVRYWAVSARPGVDTAFDPGQMKIGRRLAIKILNASKFVIGRLSSAGDGAAAAPKAPLDRALVAGLADLVADATGAFDGYDYTRALDRTEAFFWSFCDDYLELVKSRAYGALGEEGSASAEATLRVALTTLLGLFAPFLPFVTEEVWSWWQEGSVHRSPWPDAGALRALAAEADPAVLEAAARVLSEVRKAKTSAQVSLRTAAALVVVRDTPGALAALREAEADVCEAGAIGDLRMEEAPEFSVAVTLGAAAGRQS
ncbi:MAG: valine--tRNA ligase [Actinomycetota bacterium]